MSGRVHSAEEGAEMKILLALDGSEPSSVARDLVANLAWPAGTSVHLLAAYRPPIDYTGGVGSAMVWVGDIEDAVRDQLTEMLATMGAPLTARGVTSPRPSANGGPPPAASAAAFRGRRRIDHHRRPGPR